MHGTEDDLRGAVLEQETGGAGVQGGSDHRVGVEGGQHKDLGVRAVGGDLGGGPDAVSAGHVQVHEDDVGAQTTSRVVAAAPVGPLAEDRDAGVALQDETQGGAHEGVVVNDDNTYTALR